MKILKRISLGCVVLAVALVVILAVTVGIMMWLGPPEQTPEQATRSQELETPGLPEAVNPAPGEVIIPPRSLRVRLDLAEGKFRILRGNPGEGIRIEADYDSGVYELQQEHRPGDGGTEEVHIRFFSKYSIMRRLLTMGAAAEADNRIDIYLPPGIPMSIEGTLKMGETETDLTGLALTGLDLNLEMGEHELRLDEPNPLGMENMRLYISKGEFRTHGLGNAGFRTADIQGSMGEASIDLGGAYQADAVVRTRFRMGEMRVTVPEDIHVNVQPGMVFLGERNVRVKESGDVPEGAPTLEVQSSLSMGELTIRSR
jgi:hypothetical protein